MDQITVQALIQLGFAVVTAALLLIFLLRVVWPYMVKQVEDARRELKDYREVAEKQSSAEHAELKRGLEEVVNALEAISNGYKKPTWRA